jgi:hypothetical protein
MASNIPIITKQRLIKQLEPDQIDQSPDVKQRMAKRGIDLGAALFERHPIAEKTIDYRDEC